MQRRKSLIAALSMCRGQAHHAGDTDDQARDAYPRGVDDGRKLGQCDGRKLGHRLVLSSLPGSGF